MEEKISKQTLAIKLLLIALLSVIVVFVVYIAFSPRNNAERKFLEQEVKRLNGQLDSLKSNRVVLDSIEAKLTRNISRMDALDTSLLRQQKGYDDKIKNVKSQYEKINRVDTFSANSITKFFADEFGHK